jgi:hypothetical protein
MLGVGTVPEVQPQFVPLNGGPLLAVPEGRSVIGSDRALADLWLPRPAVSDRHCEVTWQGGICIVHDLGSSTGVCVNRHRTIRTIVEPGDELDLAGCRYTFRLQPVVAPPPSEMPGKVVLPPLEPAPSREIHDANVPLAAGELDSPAAVVAAHSRISPFHEAEADSDQHRPAPRPHRAAGLVPSRLAPQRTTPPADRPSRPLRRSRNLRTSGDPKTFRRAALGVTLTLVGLWLYLPAGWLTGPSSESIYSTCARHAAEIQQLRTSQAPAGQWNSAAEAASLELQPLAHYLEGVAGWETPAEQQLLFLTRDLIPLAYAGGPQPAVEIDAELTAAIERARRLLDGIPDPVPDLPPEVGPTGQTPMPFAQSR